MTPCSAWPMLERKQCLHRSAGDRRVWTIAMPSPTIRYAVFGLSLLALPVAAHHSPAQFDLTKDATIEGVIATLSWRNPHVYLDLDVTGANGGSTRQRIEAGPVSNLVALRFDSDSLRVGERVTVQVKPNRNGEGRTA